MPNFFEICLEEAREAFKENEVPIGAVIVKDNKVIAQAHNQTEHYGHFIAHAETLCIEKATKVLGTKYLNECSLYVSLEPCGMCRFAASLSRIESVFYLLPSEKYGKKGDAYPKVTHTQADAPEINESLQLMQNFFEKKR